MLNVFVRRVARQPICKTSVIGNRTYSILPRIASPSLWQSLVPKTLRNRESKPSTKSAVQKKPWNPATFFILIFLVIGSNAINILAVKQDYLSFSRQADAKIAALKEAIERLQRGENVDVKKLLGTGDAVAEQEWEDVLKELQQERSPQDTRAARRAAKRAEAAREAAKANEAPQKITGLDDEQDQWTKPQTGEGIVRKVDFY